MTSAVFLIRRNEKTSSIASSPASVSNSPRKNASSFQKSSAEDDKIILGNITTVPFQELYGLLSSRSREEVAQLAEQLKALPASGETDARITVFFKAWAHLDAKAAFTTAASFKSVAAKGAAIAAVIEGADPIAASSLAQSVVALPPDALPSWQRAGFLSKALSKWSQIDPVAAANFLDAFGKTDRSVTGARVSIAQNWAASDPQAALAWAQTSSEDPSGRFAVSAAIMGWWHNDPRAAEAYVVSHLDTVGMETVMSLTRQIFGQDPQRAKEWATQLSTLQARVSATTFIAVQLATSDPTSAAQWVVTLPDELRERGVQAVANFWARRDPEAAAGWVNGLAGPTRDQAVSAYGSALSNKDPTAALTWAATISDEKIRNSSVQRIVTGWLRRSPDAATAWIQSSNLSEPEKKRLLELPAGR